MEKLQIIDFSEYESLLNDCVEEIKANEMLMERPEITIMGKLCRQNRNVGFFSNNSEGYRYSGQIMNSKPLTENLEKLLMVVNDLLGSDYNGILINEYLDGNNSIGAHSDDISALGNIGVFSISYGTSRIFRIRDKKTKTKLLDINTEHLQGILMKDDFQKLFTHEIPIQKRCKTGRISFTFRKHLI